MTVENICFAALFLAEAITAEQYFSYLFSPQKSKTYLAGSYFVGYCLLFFVSLLNNTTVNAISFLIVNYVVAVSNFPCSRKTALLHTAFLCFIMVGSEILVALLIGLFGFEFSAYTYNFRVMVVFGIFSKLLYLSFSVIGSRIFAPHKHKNEDPQRMLLFCSLPLLSSVVAVIIVYWGMTAGISGTVWGMTVMMVVTLLLVNLILLALYNYLQQANEEHLALQLSIQKEQADTAYYQALQEQLENQRILVHDIRKHLATIDALAKENGDEEVENYIATINDTFAPSTHAKLCSEPILNLILLSFRDACNAQNVVFHCDARQNISSFMDTASITTLYGNLLSNALEAAEVSSDKQIELSITRNSLRSVVIISIINSCDIAPVPDGHGGFYTRKADKNIHGVGLRSIRRIVKKYNGVATMYYDSDKRQFHHIVQFPIPEIST